MTVRGTLSLPPHPSPRITSGAGSLPRYGERVTESWIPATCPREWQDCGLPPTDALTGVRPWLADSPSRGE